MSEAGQNLLSFLDGFNECRYIVWTIFVSDSVDNYIGEWNNSYLPIDISIRMTASFAPPGYTLYFKKHKELTEEPPTVKRAATEGAS